VLTLKCSELKDARAPWAARLRYAYADALEAVGDRVGALEWFSKAAAADPHGETEAAERLADLQGVVFEDSFDEEDPHDAGPREQAPATARRSIAPEPIAPEPPPVGEPPHAEMLALVFEAEPARPDGLPEDQVGDPSAQ